MHTNEAGNLPPRRYGCPVELTLKVIGGKWKCVILWWLRQDRKSFGELKQLIPGITAKVLTQQLRELQDSGLIRREAYRSAPRRVEYFLTAEGEILKPLIDLMSEWGKTHLPRFQSGFLNLADLRLLVVSRRASICELLRSELTARHAQVRIATSAPEALAIIGSMPFAAMPFAAIVVDLEISDQGGLTLIQEIRILEESQEQSIAAIALTSPTQPLERQLALQAKFQVCLTHPIDPAELATTIACLTGILERS